MEYPRQTMPPVTYTATSQPANQPTSQRANDTSHVGHVTHWRENRVKFLEFSQNCMNSAYIIIHVLSLLGNKVRYKAGLAIYGVLEEFPNFRNESTQRKPWLWGVRFSRALHAAWFIDVQMRVSVGGGFGCRVGASKRDLRSQFGGAWAGLAASGRCSS